MDTRKEPQSMKDRPFTRWRNFTAFWILGLCNNYGFTIVLSAANDILKSRFNAQEKPHLDDPGSSRDCNDFSIGAILFANILPCLLVKLTVPFLPFYVHYRLFVCVFTSATGLLAYALAESQFFTMFGVVLGSISTGLGEISILPYLHKYAKENITAWSSGTGASGIVAAMLYSVLRKYLTTETTILIMLYVPVAQAFAFWILLIHPDKKSAMISIIGGDDKVIKPPKKTMFKKISLLKKLWIYCIPLGLVYLFEFFINTGLHELIQFKGIFLDYKAQYRWYHTAYQVGVFISRSSTTFITFRRIWPMTILQFLNVVLFLLEARYYISPNIWIVFALILWEGLLGGGAYVNTFHKMTDEIPPEDLRDSLQIVTFADALGITIAAVAAMSVHPAICETARPERLFL